MKVRMFQLETEATAGTGLAGSVGSPALAEEEATKPKGEMLFPYAPGPLYEECSGKRILGPGSGEGFQEPGMPPMGMQGHGLGTLSFNH